MNPLRILEVSPDDVASLSDEDLRHLLRRLALAEVRAEGLPTSAVTAGGTQDAADGGVDIRIELPRALSSPQFIPRYRTIFQAKKSDMTPSKIVAEMCPAGRLRPAIAALAETSGAYVLASSGASLTDAALLRRLDTMRHCVSSEPSGHQIHVDFYDRDRIAAWANEHPGAAAWVRLQLGRDIFGWRPPDVQSVFGPEAGPFLVDGTACIVDERTSERMRLPILEGIEQIRSILRHSGRSVRLIGLSGVGKTRLVSALFEPGVGDTSLDSSSALYTDYSQEIRPSATEMAEHLVSIGIRCLLIIDNCNPATHAVLTKICTSGRSRVSLLTVEYDVRDDEPEATEVFRLEQASTFVVCQWLLNNYSYLKRADADRIAKFADSNFRVARALADTVSKGDTLGHLKDEQLFERLFVQRNSQDQELFRAAGALSLLYSVNGEDLSAGSDLDNLGRVATLSPLHMRRHLEELFGRGLVQRRGRWAAVLPHALANRAATKCLRSLPQELIDDLAGSLNQRSQISLSRRIGFLHDSPAAAAAAIRWLAPGGLLADILTRSDGVRLLANLAPAVPETVLTVIERALAKALSDQNHKLARELRLDLAILLASLAQHERQFARAVTALATLMEIEGVESESSIVTYFQQLFVAKDLMTEEEVAPRLEVVRAFFSAGREQVGRLALAALLDFSTRSWIEDLAMGARPSPRGAGDSVPDLQLRRTIEAVVSTAEGLSQTSAVAKKMFADKLGPIWRQFPEARDTLRTAILAVARDECWVDAWISLRTCLNADGANGQLLELIAATGPRTLADRVEAHVVRAPIEVHEVLDRSWDWTPGVTDDEADPRVLGSHCASDTATLERCLRNIIADDRGGADFQFGEGLALASQDFGMPWALITNALGQFDPHQPSLSLALGFLRTVCFQDRCHAMDLVRRVSAGPHLLWTLPALQNEVGIDDAAAKQLTRMIVVGEFEVADLAPLAEIRLENVASSLIIGLLDAASHVENGLVIALRAIDRLVNRDEFSTLGKEALRPLAQSLLLRAIDKPTQVGDAVTRRVARTFLDGPEGAATFTIVAQRLKILLRGRSTMSRLAAPLIRELFRIAPSASLDAFLAEEAAVFEHTPFPFGLIRPTPVETLDIDLLIGWASKEPNRRYRLLSMALATFEHSYEVHPSRLIISPKLMSLFECAVDKIGFLGSDERLHPIRGDSPGIGNVAERQAAMRQFVGGGNDVANWVAKGVSNLATSAQERAERQHDAEQKFE